MPEKQKKYDTFKEFRGKRCSAMKVGGTGGCQQAGFEYDKGNTNTGESWKIK